MVRPKKDPEKNKENTSVRLDKRDVQRVKNLFGTFQMGIDVFVSMLEDDEQIVYLLHYKELLEEQRRRQ